MTAHILSLQHAMYKISKIHLSVTFVKFFIEVLLVQELLETVTNAKFVFI